MRFESAAAFHAAFAPRKHYLAWVLVGSALIAALLVYALMPRPHSSAPLIRLSVLPLQSAGCEKVSLEGVVYEVSDRLQRLQELVSIPASSVSSAAYSFYQQAVYLIRHDTKESDQAMRLMKRSVFRLYDLRSGHATRLSADGVADERVTQMLRQTDAKVCKKYSQMKLADRISPGCLKTALATAPELPVPSRAVTVANRPAAEQC
jgi:hypothetical protein